jgi:hypothetical protein
MKPRIRYLKFLELIDSLSGTEFDLKLHFKTIKLLEAITLHAMIDQTLTVSDALALRNLASPATIHRRIDYLIDVKLIRYEYRSSNKKAKFLVPTKQTLAYFRKINELMLSVMK